MSRLAGRSSSRGTRLAGWACPRSRATQKIPDSVEVSFSAETKRVLHHAFDEADGLTHRHIGPEHLLLGLMRDPESRAAAILARYGMQLEGARQQLRESYAAAAANPMSGSPVHAHLEQIIESPHQLCASLSGDAALQADMLLVDLETLKSLLNEQQ
jgi:ATP-dependent Clp protease ATP-binding subunit ClpA